MEELYVEILYTILHMIGCDAEKAEISSLGKKVYLPLTFYY